MGLRKRGGKWYYRFKYRGVLHSGPTGLVATERNRSAALMVEAEARKLVQSGQAHLLKLEAKAFNEAANEFLDWARGEHRDKPATARRLETSFASLRTFLGTRAVDAITAGDIERYKTVRRNEHKVKEVTIRHDLHALSPFFDFAIKQNWCHANPVKSVTIPSDKDAIRMHVLTPGEEVAYFKAAAKWSNLHDIGRLIILQGCRPDEVMRIEREHVDLVAGTLRIAIGKTLAARRVLRLTPESRSILARRFAEGGRLAFPSRKLIGKPITKLNNQHDLALKASGAQPPFVLYDLRHTCATRWAQAGIDLPTIAKWLGHNNLRSVQKYVHPTAAHDVEMAKRYEAYLEVLHAPVVEKGRVQ